MGGTTRDNGYNNVHLGERVAKLEAMIPLIQQGIKEQFDALRAYYDQKSLQQALEWQAKISDMMKEISDLKLLLSARPTPSEPDQRLFWGIVYAGIIVTILVVAVISVFFQLSRLQVIRNG